ncbi:HEAT repeat domain-containing protein [Nocardioides sp. CPCC 206347]
MHDEHPLVRLAAAWTGPYLASEDIADALDAVAASDPEPDVRSAAAESAAALAQLATGPQPRH